MIIRRSIHMIRNEIKRIRNGVKKKHEKLNSSFFDRLVEFFLEGFANKTQYLILSFSEILCSPYSISKSVLLWHSRRAVKFVIQNEVSLNWTQTWIQLCFSWIMFIQLQFFPSKIATGKSQTLILSFSIKGHLFWVRNIPCISFCWLVCYERR